MRTIAWPLALGACVLLNRALFSTLPVSTQERFPPILSSFSTVEGASFAVLGARRLAADLGLIDLFLYYGAEVERTAGAYPEIEARAKAVIDLDPAFIYPALYASGALTFNLDRPQEGLEILKYALARNPDSVEIRGYIGAIAFSRYGNKREIIRLLEPYLESPDCPTMMKSLVAFLYLQMGETNKAKRLYREIIETSRDPGYRDLAQRQLAKLE